MKKYITLLLLVFGSISFKLHAQAYQPIRIIYVDPSTKVIALSTFILSDSNIGDWRLSSNGVDTPLSKLTVVIGSVANCKSFANVVLQGLALNDKKGSLSLHLPNMPVDSHSLHDFLQWGDSGQLFESDAADKKLWRKGRYIKENPPFSFKCTYGDHDDTCWQGIKKPVITVRFAYVSPISNTVCIKNLCASNIDLSTSALCINGNCYDTIKNIPMNILKGNLNVPKNDSVVIQFTNDSIKSSGSLAIFLLPKIYNDTSVLLDFVQWGDSMQPYSSLAAQKGIWDSLQTVHLNRNDSIVYTGNFTFAQSGASYWQNRHLQGVYIDEAMLNYISIFPNPAHQVLNVRATLSDKIYYQVFDLSGKTVLSGNFVNQHALDIADWNAGVYYIKVFRQDGNPAMIKMVKID